MKVTIDDALRILAEAKSRLGGDKCMVLSLTDSQLEDADVTGISIVEDGGSHYVQVECLHPSLASQGRWIISTESTAGGDYNHKLTADSPAEAAEAVRQQLHDETWTDEDGEEDADDVPAWDAFCRTCLGCGSGEQEKIEAAFKAQRTGDLFGAKFEFNYDDGSVEVVREE